MRVLLTPEQRPQLPRCERPRVAPCLGLDGSDAPGLVLNGDDSRAILNVNEDGPALAMTGARGALRAILALVKGQPGLVFFDGEERERVRFAVDESGGGGGLLNGADGGTTWRMPDRE